MSETPKLNLGRRALAPYGETTPAVYLVNGALSEVESESIGKFAEDLACNLHGALEVEMAVMPIFSDVLLVRVEWTQTADHPPLWTRTEISMEAIADGGEGLASIVAEALTDNRDMARAAPE